MAWDLDELREGILEEFAGGQERGREWLGEGYRFFKTGQRGRRRLACAVHTRAQPDCKGCQSHLDGLERCKGPDCQRLWRIKGFCRAHYLQAYRGEPLKALRPKRGTCRGPGCKRKAVEGKALCDAHFRQVARGERLRTLRGVLEPGLPVSTRQLQILRLIAASHREQGYGPSLRELMADLNISSPNGIREHLGVLEERGLVFRGDQKSRALSLTELGRKVAGLPPDPAALLTLYQGLERARLLPHPPGCPGGPLGGCACPAGIAIHAAAQKLLALGEVVAVVAPVEVPHAA